MYQVFVNNQLYINEVFATKDSALEFMNIEHWNVEEFEIKPVEKTEQEQGAKIYDLSAYRSMYAGKAHRTVNG